MAAPFWPVVVQKAASNCPSEPLNVSEGLKFTRGQRLLRPAEFQAVFDGAVLKVGETGFLLLAQPNQLGQSRIGIVVAKKKVRLAVNRNRIKRIVRDSFRCHQYELPDVDLIFMVRQDLAKLSNPELHHQLQQAWKRLSRKAARELKSPGSVTGTKASG